MTLEWFFFFYLILLLAITVKKLILIFKQIKDNTFGTLHYAQMPCHTARKSHVKSILRNFLETHGFNWPTDFLVDIFIICTPGTVRKSNARKCPSGRDFASPKYVRNMTTIVFFSRVGDWNVRCTIE